MATARSETDLEDVIEYCDLQDLLEKMQERGSSVDLNYGEDNGSWECSWIVGGQRFTEFSSVPDDAARSCARKVLDHLRSVR